LFIQRQSLCEQSERKKLSAADLFRALDDYRAQPPEPESLQQPEDQLSSDGDSEFKIDPNAGFRLDDSMPTTEEDEAAQKKKEWEEHNKFVKHLDNLSNEEYNAMLYDRSKKPHPDAWWRAEAGKWWLGQFEVHKPHPDDWWAKEAGRWIPSRNARQYAEGRVSWGKPFTIGQFDDEPEFERSWLR
jgi:hypothetical protein